MIAREDPVDTGPLARRPRRPSNAREKMATEVVGSGMLARAFASAAATLPGVIVCAAGVSDSACADPAQFARERDLVGRLVARARDAGTVLIYLSGAPVYGDSAGIRRESDPLRPRTPYGRHKVAMEELVAAASERWMILRLPNVVGPGGNPRQLVPWLVAGALAGTLAVQEEATRDIIDVADVVDICAGLLARGAENQVLNVASGRSSPVWWLGERVSKALGATATVRREPGGIPQRFSVVRLSDALPRRTLPFPEDYHAEVIRRYAQSIANGLLSQTRP